MEFYSETQEKQVVRRVRILLEDPQLMAVFNEFGAEPFRRSSVFHGLDQFLRECKVRGRLCFEIGTWNGLTALILSRYFDQVVTVDIAHNPLKHQILELTGTRNVSCIDIADNAEKAAVAKDLDFDFAYLDGDHANDTPADWAMTKRCGNVLFHECWPWQEPVFELVNQLPPREVTLGGAGLALWRAK